MLNSRQATPYLVLVLLLTTLLTACDKEPRLTPLAVDATVLAFGDSLTYGTGAPKPKIQSYPAVLSQLINRKVINAGIPGEVSSTGLIRLPKLLKQYQPSLVVLCHGGNDILRKQSASQTEQNIGEMVELIQQSGAEVILVTVPDFNLMLKPADFYQRIADKYELPIENTIMSQIERKRSLKSDSIHPNVQGYALMANSIYAIFQSSGAL